jgi:hypothetical protein
MGILCGHPSTCEPRGVLLKVRDRPGAGLMVSLSFCPSLVVERQLIDIATRGEVRLYAALFQEEKWSPKLCWSVKPRDPTTR